jgi:hypothetical protein
MKLGREIAFFDYDYETPTLEMPGFTLYRLRLSDRACSSEL